MATYHAITGLCEATGVTLKRCVIGSLRLYKWLDVAMEALTITCERLELPDQD